MERRHFVAGAAVVLTATAGCLRDSDSSENSDDDSGTDDGSPGGSFSETVEFPRHSVAGENLQVRVTVENTGDSESTYETALTANGSDVTSGSATLGPQEERTVTLAHTFESAGEQSLSVAGAESTVTVYETPLALFQEGDFDVGTRVIEEETSQLGEGVIEGTPFELTEDRSATIRKNFDEETQYTEEEVTTTTNDQTEEQTIEEWIVDGTLHQRITNNTEGEVTYNQEQSDEFDSEADYSDPVVAQYIDTAHTDDEYVFTMEPSTASAATEVWAALSDSPGESFPPDAVGSITVEARLDSERLRPAHTSITVTIEEFEGFEFLNISIEREPVEYNVPVTVEVPDEVRDELSG